MKTLCFLILIVFTLCLTAITQAQSKSYAEMTEKEKADFVAGKIDEITEKISGKKYRFNSDFKLQVSNYVDAYAKRVGNNRKTGDFAEDLKFVLQRGSESAPAINKAFDKSGIARLSGLYIAMIESEFNPNISSPTGSYGLFQIDKSRAQKYGLPLKERADVEKAANLAARYLKDNQIYFAEHKMKEFLAVLSWNRDPKKINFDINFKFMFDDENLACPICGLTGSPTRFDQQFQTEAVKYIPKFLAAAIVGENPQDFGLSTKPLSTLGAETSQTALDNNSGLNVSLDYWKQQLNKALEPRQKPVGSELKEAIIPQELVGNNGKQKTTLEAMKAQGFAVPMDFFDLAEMNLTKELVELPLATETYVLDIGGMAADKVFTKFNFKDGAIIPAANSDSQRKMKELADNFDGQKYDLNNPNDRKKIRLRLLRMLSPQAKMVLEEIARQYQAKFNRPLRVTSLVRSIDYSIELNKVNAGSFLVTEDGAIPPHCSGLAFDFAIKNLTAEEQNFIANILTEMDKNGKVDAIRETGATAVFHVFVL